MTRPAKDLPIIFSGQMVQAILQGRKTMTRRVLRDQATWDRVEAIVRRWPNQKAGVPYAPGDLLWVREAWNLYHEDEDEGPERCVIRYRASEYDITQLIPSRYEEFGQTDDRRFDAAKALAQRWRETWSEVEGWRPSIFMPRWASRITLQVEAVKVERLQEISEADAEAEGANAFRWVDPAGSSPSPARDNFALLWDHLHGAGAWEANPWVAAITFRKVEP